MTVDSYVLFDHVTLESEWGPESAQEMVQCFAEDTAKVLQDFSQFAEEKNPDKIRTQAHMLKGCCRAICAREVEKTSADIEAAALAQDWPNILSNIVLLQPLYLKLVQELGEYLQRTQK
jgi:HPt (histidine-containing phosphotransfer) domain-containing protein